MSDSFKTLEKKLLNKRIFLTTILFVFAVSCNSKSQKQETKTNTKVKTDISEIMSVKPASSFNPKILPSIPNKMQLTDKNKNSLPKVKLAWPKPLTKSKVTKYSVTPDMLYKKVITYPEEHIRKDFLYLKSKILEKRVPVHVILPESYEKNPDRYYPFVIFLGGNHYIKGGPFSSVRYWDWIFNIARRYSNILSGNLNHEITSIFKGKYLSYWKNQLKSSLPAEMIVVLPHTEDYTDFTGYNKYLNQELLPVLFKNYRLLTSPDFAGIDGISLGGTEALLIAFKNLDLFHVIGASQPALQFLTEPLYKKFVKNKSFLIKNNIPINWITGTTDLTRRKVVRFYKRLKKHKFRLFFRDYPGGHDYYFYQGVGSLDILLYYGYRFAENFLKFKKFKVKSFGNHQFSEQAKLVAPIKNYKPHRDNVVLVSEYKNKISLFSDVKLSVKKNSRKAVFSGFIKFLPVGTMGKRLKSFKKGISKNSIAELVVFPDGTKGWVSINNIAIPARITKKEPRHRGTRAYVTASIHSKVVELLPPRASVFIYARDALNLWKYSQCDLQLERVFTLSGKTGYVDCSYLGKRNSSFKP